MSVDIHAQRILILDFGSQYTQLIARRVREIGVYSEVRAFDMDAEEIKAFKPKGIILAGGPESVTGGETSPRAPAIVFEMGVPVLGICYGMQTMAEQLGGKVESSAVHEFGYAQIKVAGESALLHDIKDHVDTDSGAALLDVWMSHGDKVVKMPDDFQLMASTDSCPIAGMYQPEKHLYGIQFHPEVTHTLQGKRIFEHFALELCGCEALWTAANIVEDAINTVREQVGTDKVLLGLSGGVDSSVVAALLHRAIGDQLTCGHKVALYNVEPIYDAPFQVLDNLCVGCWNNPALAAYDLFQRCVCRPKDKRDERNNDKVNHAPTALCRSFSPRLKGIDCLTHRLAPVQIARQAWPLTAAKPRLGGPA